MPIIQSLERAFHILDLFDEQTHELKITEISARTNLHKSTVHSLLKTLQLHGYIDQDDESGKYRLGLKLLEKGQLLLQRMDIRTVARKHLVGLSETTGQTTHLVILDGREGVYIDKVEGAKAAIRYSRIGRRVPLHSSAVGKTLLAFRSPEDMQRLLTGYVYTAFMPNTIQHEGDFLQELTKVRNAGYAVDNEENEPGVRCAAAPVFDHTGAIAAAVSISTMLASVDDGDFKRFTALLCNEAAAISEELGFR